MGNDLVSIIMLSHGRTSYIEETVRSVMEQTYQNWELMFIDDAHDKQAIRIVSELKGNDKRIHVYQSASHQGSPNARNMALQNAKGRWIAFIDAGDIWLPEKLEHQIEFMEENHYEFSYTEYIRKEKRIVGGPSVLTWMDLHRYCWINALTMMYDAKGIGKVYTQGINQLTDAYELMIEIARSADCYLLPECLAKSRKLGQANIFTKIAWQYRVLCYAEEVNPIIAFGHMVQYLYFGLVKRLKYSKII